MKKNLLKSTFLLAFGCSLMLNAQKTDQISSRMTDDNGHPKLVVFQKSASYSLNAPMKVFREQLKLSDNDSYARLRSEVDRIGFTHEKYQQFYKGLKVEFATYSLHAKNGKVTSISGEYYEVTDILTTPKLSNQEAFARALSHVGAKNYLWEYPGAAKEMDNYQKPKGELVVLPLFDQQSRGNIYKLAYKFDIYATNPVSRGDLYIDAITGEALFYNAIIKHATTFGHIGEVSNAELKSAKETLGMMVSGSAETRYSGTRTIETSLNGSNYTLNDTSRKVYTRDALNQAPGSTYPYINNYAEFTDNDNNWTTAEHSVNKDNAALDAHWGAMMTYDYWTSIHGRNSYDNSGAQIRSYVHVDNNYDNAFWNGSVMSYGDGSSNGSEGNGNFDALTSIDVAAHEIGHAVCTFTANLAYQRESGALNEGFSDIWGAAVEHFAKGNGSDTAPSAEVWLIGDEIDRRTGSSALRSMSDPKSKGQPDTYGGTYWINPNCGTPTRFNDYCGVHTNSGLLNYWFYLLSAGGSGTNDIGSNYTVSAIGISKAAAIAYRLESVYLSANSTHADARSFGIQAAIDLYGAGSAEEIAVTDAWYAVGVGSSYGGGGTTSYCSSQGNNVGDEYINIVQLGTINNTSGSNGGYADFTALSTNLSKGVQATITITPTWTGTVYAEGYAVWIDYNQDNDFDDAGELVYSRAATTATPVSGSFTVPTTATDGATRMRVSMKYNGIPTSCETFTYGEVEDYTVTIGGSGADTEAPSAPANLIATNVTETTLDLSWDAATDNVGVTEYDVYQGTTLLGSTSNTSTGITGLTAATNYTFSVKAKDAAGNESASSNEVSVTTDTGSTADTEAPTAPTGLAASNVTQTTLDLSWNAASDNVGVTEYDVYQGSSLIGTTSGTSTGITGLTASTTYSFSVRAKDAAANVSPSSNVVTVTTQSGSGGGPVSDVLHQGFFETGLDGWIDGGSDCYRYSGSFSYEGNSSMRLRDNSGVASSMTLGSFDVSSYDEIDIEFYFYANSMENGEDFWVRFYDGSSWNTVAAYASGSNFNNGTFYTATVTISKTNYNFPANAQFRFQCDASANADQVYIDQITITARSGGAGVSTFDAIALGGGVQTFAGNSDLEIDGFIVYPNPVVNTLLLQRTDDSEASYSITNLIGQTILQGTLLNNQINVSSLAKGVYLISVSDEEETTIKKFIKQ
ncbi:M4 family metallopeptidase [Flavobacteriaceae bacterium M23B6Z8]